MRLCSLEVNKIAEITVPSDEPYQENESNQITKECQGQHMWVLGEKRKVREDNEINKAHTRVHFRSKDRWDENENIAIRIKIVE